MTISFLAVILASFVVAIFFAYQFIQVRGLARDNRATIIELERLRSERVTDQTKALTTTCRRYNIISLVTSNTLDYLLEQAVIFRESSRSPEVREYHNDGPPYITGLRRNIAVLDCNKLLSDDPKPADPIPVPETP